MISKALTWVLKRTIEEGDEQDEGEEKLVADSEGWVDLEDVVSPQYPNPNPNPRISTYTFPALQTPPLSPPSLLP